MNITYIQEGETDTLSLKRSLDTGTEEQRLAVQRIIEEVRKMVTKPYGLSRSNLTVSLLNSHL